MNEYLTARAFVLLWILIFAALWMGGCTNPIQPSKSPPPGTIIITREEPPKEPISDPQPEIADETLYWQAAPGCNPIPRIPDLTNAEVRRDDVRGNKREVMWWVPGPQWFIDSTFHRVGGKWLVCQWDSRGIK